MAQPYHPDTLDLICLLLLLICELDRFLLLSPWCFLLATATGQGRHSGRVRQGYPGLDLRDFISYRSRLATIKSLIKVSPNF